MSLYIYHIYKFYLSVDATLSSLEGLIYNYHYYDHNLVDFY